MLCQLHDGYLLFGPFTLVIWNHDRCRLGDFQCRSTAPPQGAAALVRQQGASHITRQATYRLGGSTLLLAACVPDTGQHRLLHLMFIVCKHVSYCRAQAQTSLQDQQALCPVSALHSPALSCPALPLSCLVPALLSCLIWFHAIMLCFCHLLDKWVALHDL
jgi:hypothetical protein